MAAKTRLVDKTYKGEKKNNDTADKEATCGRCNLIVGEKDKALGCEICEEWMHINTLEDFTRFGRVKIYLRLVDFTRTERVLFFSCWCTSLTVGVCTFLAVGGHQTLCACELPIILLCCVFVPLFLVIRCKILTCVFMN